MDEQKFDQLIRAAAERYRVPPPAEPRLDAIWPRIEAKVFAPRETRVAALPKHWGLPLLAYAAVLLLGIGLGYGAARVTPRGRAPRPIALTPESLVRPARNGPSPFVGVATNYLQKTTALLVAFAGDIPSGRILPGTVAQARELLSTTRLLLDAGVEDPALRDLLEDLELVLAQIMGLPEVSPHPARPAPDAALIRQTLDQRDVLPRLTLLLADAGVAP